ncbi:hypothetical protein [Hufsiella ginkgonis]|uniref:Uncharacterized protein n=1 Tax=Hufsiella ginkgonis TaxID=2695274 RepID=A0A7K1Y1I7_9SPHI|nr:hypothetical protein [Hufsiella ginkgonis]MXV16987.1 hypothetical protein [Hufsiella ginkgonis]
MGQIFTVTFNQSRYQYRIVQANLTGDVPELQVLVPEGTVTLCKEKHGWIQKDGAASILGEAIKAIGNSISLRYRV